MPNFKKSRGFKMDGYSYAGTSPLSLTEEAAKNLKENVSETMDDDNKLTVDASSEEGKALLKQDQEQANQQSKKSQGKKNFKIDWDNITTNAISSVVQVGAQAGIEALVKPRKRSSKNAGGAFGSMGDIKYGTDTNLLNNKKS